MSITDHLSKVNKQMNNIVYAVYGLTCAVILEMAQDTYTLDYLKGLIDNGFISLDEPMRHIYRIENDGRRTQIYPISSSVNEKLMKSGVAKTEEEYRNCENDDEVILNAPKEICVWNDTTTKKLLDLYQQYMSKVGPLKEFKTKKNLWAKIAVTLNEYYHSNVSGLQCENRYKTVLKRKKSAVDNNNTSGSLRKQIPFEEELNKIASLDDSIEPEVVGTASGVKLLKRSTTQPSTISDISSDSSSIPSTSNIQTTEDTTYDSVPSTLKRKRSKTVQETLMEIYEKKEAARERRHQEKLALIRELFNNDK